MSSLPDELSSWIEKPEVRNFEADLFRRLAIGYAMMCDEWHGGAPIVEWSKQLHHILESSLSMRRNVMDANVRLIKEAYWGQDLSKSMLLKEIARMVTQGDYQVCEAMGQGEPRPADLVCRVHSEEDRSRSTRDHLSHRCFLTRRRAGAATLGDDQ